mmetsp:Transcript_122533/g.306040  ORF Transcript_122533/g.306040 Transcript_122533/m.306040 type:complete len:221 (+) Transcript_122533:328-990(+)
MGHGLGAVHRWSVDRLKSPWPALPCRPNICHPRRSQLPQEAIAGAGSAHGREGAAPEREGAEDRRHDRHRAGRDRRHLQVQIWRGRVVHWEETGAYADMLGGGRLHHGWLVRQHERDVPHRDRPFRLSGVAVTAVEGFPLRSFGPLGHACAAPRGRHLVPTLGALQEGGRPDGGAGGELARRGLPRPLAEVRGVAALRWLPRAALGHSVIPYAFFTWHST